MKIRIVMFTFALSVAASGTLLASDIFTWTDEDGVVHYSDDPSEGSNVERLSIRSRPTDPAVVQSEAQFVIDERARRAEEEALAAQGPSPEELQAAAREREEQCAKYTARQVEFTNNRRIYRMDENSERVYYDEAEMAAARAGVDGLVTKYCD